MIQEFIHAFLHPTRRVAQWHGAFQLLLIPLVMGAWKLGLWWGQCVLVTALAQWFCIASSSLVSGVAWIHDGWGTLQFYKRAPQPFGYWGAVLLHFLAVVPVGLCLWGCFLAGSRP